MLEIDRLKANTLKLLVKLWEHLYTAKPAEIIDREVMSPLVCLAFDLQVPIVNSLGQLVQTSAFSQATTFYTETFIKAALQSLSLFCREQGTFATNKHLMGSVNPHREFFIGNGVKLFMEIVLPLLRLTDEQVSLADDNPSEFVNMTADLIGDRESQSKQARAIELLYRLEAHVEGCRNVMVDFCLGCLGKAIGVETTPTQQMATPVEESMVEVCLLILTLLYSSIEHQLTLQVIFDTAIAEVMPMIADFKIIG